jgi:Flp pilus assembly protein CpaB
VLRDLIRKGSRSCTIHIQMSGSAARPPDGHILVVAEPIAYGAAVTADNVTDIPWFTNTLPEGAFATKEDLLDGGRRIVLSSW